MTFIERIRAMFARPEPLGEVQNPLDLLVAESQRIGREIDALRDQRKAIRAEIDALLAARDATVPGQVLEVKMER